MKKTITISVVLFMGYFSLAQQITVESIYEKYINAIGGKEKIQGVTNIMEYSKSQGTMHTKVDNETLNSEMEIEVITEIIYFVDVTLNQKALLTKNGKIYTKLIEHDGKKYIEAHDGKRTEIDNNGTEPPISIFIGSEIKPNSEVLPNEMYNSEEVYVIKYKGEKTMTNMISNDVYEFFSVNTGLLVAFKQDITMEANIQSVTVIDFSDYKEVQGILIPHTNNAIITTKTGDGGSEMNIQTTVVPQLNVDVKDFQENCFKKPEKCFKKYN